MIQAMVSLENDQWPHLYPAESRKPSSRKRAGEKRRDAIREEGRRNEGERRKGREKWREGERR